MSKANEPEDMLEEAAGLVTRCRRGSLATRLAREDQAATPGFPYISLVLLAADEAGQPFLLLSDLSEHAQNLQRDPDLALLLDETADKEEPLAHARLALMGQARQESDPEKSKALKAAFIAAHPKAKLWAAFADFKPYRIDWIAAHFVAGFGRIAWLDSKELMGLVRSSAHQG